MSRFSQWLSSSFLLLLVVTHVHAQPISGRFYRFEVVGAPGTAGMTGIPSIGPSINDNGKVAFVATMSGGTRALFMSDPGSATPRLIVQYNGFSLGGGFGINNADHVIARETYPPAATTPQFLHDFSAAPPGPYTSTLVAQAQTAGGNEQLAKALRSELSAFRNGAERQRTTLPVVPGFRINLVKAGRPYSHFFVPGGYADGDSGGHVLSELNRNIRICVAEKTKKVARVRHKYGEWWLALVDRIGYGLNTADVAALRQLLQLDHSWDKIIIVNPLNPIEGHEL